jgi:aldose 1-epimerase
MAGNEALDPSLRPLAPGPMLRIGSDALEVDVAPEAGGRIAQIRCDGVEWLAGYSADNDGAIAWGNYAMVPWVGRIRRGRFSFGGREYQLPITLGRHAIHGVGFVLPWQVTAQSATQVDLELVLPMDERWPFGGIARQRFAVDGRKLRLEVSVTAGGEAMPRPTLGWHPWFLKPEQFDFKPTQYYPRDDDYIATLPLAEPPWGKPWDDCFINTAPPVLHRGGQSLKLVSDCGHWVVFDERAHATVVEPMTGSPDAFNLYPEHVLEPGGTVSATCVMEWSPR